MVDHSVTVMTRSATTDVPAATTTTTTINPPAVRSSTSTTMVTTSGNTASAPSRQNDEVTRGIYNLKMVLLVLLLPLILLAVFLKHLLDYLFGLGLSEKDVMGKVAVVSHGDEVK